MQHRVETRHGESAAQVADRLREAILEGRLKPGERLRQGGVAATLGVSRIPVREALLQLQTEGLVTVVPNAGARVSQLDLHELGEVYWLREQVEPQLLAESVPMLTDETIELLGGLLDASEIAAEDNDLKSWLDYDRRFHLGALSAAGLPYVEKLITGFWNIARPYRSAYVGTVWRTDSDFAQTEHTLLLDAIRRRDAEAAAHLLKMHIRRTRLRLLDRHRERDTSGGGNPDYESEWAASQ